MRFVEPGGFLVNADWTLPAFYGEYAHATYLSTNAFNPGRAHRSQSIVMTTPRAEIGKGGTVCQRWHNEQGRENHPRTTFGELSCS